MTTAAPLTASAVRFDPRFAVERVDGTGVFLVSEDGAAVLGEPIHLALAGLIDGTRSADDLADALADRFSALAIYHALERMGAKGYLAAGDEATASDGQRAYWGLAGVPVAHAERELAAAGVRVATLRGLDAVILEDALAGAGLLCAAGDDAALTAIAVTDYLDAGLAAIDADQRTDGRPWLLMKPVGATVWLGPLFVPGRTG
jgi:hypothetical protein